MTMELIVGELFDTLSKKSDSGSWDLLMAHAFLDLVDIRLAMPLLLSGVRPGGLVYFTLNFDGLTAFEPVADQALERKIVRLYHETMDKRSGKGQSSGEARQADPCSEL